MPRNLAALKVNDFVRLNTDIFELFRKDTIGQIVGLYMEQVLVRLPKYDNGIIDYWFDAKYLEKM